MPSLVWEATPRLGVAGAMVLLIVVATAIRIAIAGTIGLGVDESYAVSIARHPSLSYYDHPPLSFWIVWATVKLTGSEAPIVVRLPFILIFAGTTWLMYRLASELFDPQAGLWAAVTLNLSAVFTLSIGGWVLPDGPLMFFMLASALCLVAPFFRADHEEPWIWWPAAGVCLGLAGLSKYHAALMGLGIILFILTSSRQLRWLLHPAPYLAAAISVLVCAPVLIWNYENEWISFLFQSGRGEFKGLRPTQVLTNLLGQIGYVLPWIWCLLAWLLVKTLAAGPRHERAWFLFCLAVPPIAIFTLIPLWGGRGLPHWQAPGYLFLFPLLGLLISDQLKAGARWARRWLVFSIVSLLVVLPLLAAHVATGWVRNIVPSLFEKGDPTREALNWEDLRAHMDKEGFLDRSDLFVVSTHWLEGAKIDYVLGGRLPVLVLTRNPKHFAFQYDTAEMLGRDAVVVGRRKTMRNVETRYGKYFQSLEPLGSLAITRNGHPEIDLVLYYGKNFSKPYPLPFPDH